MCSSLVIEFLKLINLYGGVFQVQGISCRPVTNYFSWFAIDLNQWSKPSITTLWFNTEIDLNLTYIRQELMLLDSVRYLSSFLL